jgi:hypothetical protein
MLETEQRLEELVKEKLGMALVIRRELKKLPALLEKPRTSSIWLEGNATVWRDSSSLRTGESCSSERS